LTRIKAVKKRGKKVKYTGRVENRQRVQRCSCGPVFKQNVTFGSEHITRVYEE